MLELDEDLLEIYLLPGEAHLARKPTMIRTLLGSCVGVTFWNPRFRIGALAHCMLPKYPQDPRLRVGEGHRYVDFAIRDLARQFDELGAPRCDVQVKLFGGGDVLLVSDAASSMPTVGKQNCAAAMEALNAGGFRVVASSLGGKVGRNIQFNTRTGEVLLRWLE